MNDVPRNDEPSDDIDDRYRRAAALDPSRPSERVRDAVLSHAAQRAAERPSDRTQTTAATAPPPSPAPTASSSSTARRRPWYKASRFVPRRLSTIVGTLAAAVLVGLLVTPRFLFTRDATLSSEPRVEVASIAAPTAAPQAALPKAEEVQSYVPRTQERGAAAARARALAGKEAQANLDAASASTQPSQTFAAPIAAAPPPAAASAPTTARPPAPSVAYTSATSSAIAQAHSLALPAAPDSPASGAALRRAAEQGDVARLQFLLDQGADVNARDADDRSPLMLAVTHSRTKIVEVLIAHNANVNAADRNGTTPLQVAESTHQTALAATLRAAGAQ